MPPGEILAGRRVVLAVSGSIAAYKAAEVARGLIKQGAHVRAVMTPSAIRFLGPATLAAITGERVGVGVLDEPERVAHVELGRWAEVFVCSGATASTLARLAGGSGEDMVSATYLMCRCPVVVAPAMHTEMWEHPAVQRNVEVLRTHGVGFVGPEVGDLASGDYGAGRLADPEAIVEAVAFALAPKDLAGLRVLLTAGPTREPMDPVRYISNRSTGRMAFALAAAAARRGAGVTVISGPATASVPLTPGIGVVKVETAEEMLAECLARYDDCDVALLNAAVADYRPASVAGQKLKKSAAPSSLDLEPTPDIAAELGRKKGRQRLVIFAAETEKVVEHARSKLESKNADLVVANLVGSPGTGFSSETNEAALVSAGGTDTLERMGKDALAWMIWDKIAVMMGR